MSISILPYIFPPTLSCTKEKKLTLTPLGGPPPPTGTYIRTTMLTPSSSFSPNPSPPPPLPQQQQQQDRLSPSAPALTPASSDSSSPGPRPSHRQPPCARLPQTRLPRHHLHKCSCKDWMLLTSLYHHDVLPVVCSVLFTKAGFTHKNLDQHLRKMSKCPKINTIIYIPLF